MRKTIVAVIGFGMLIGIVGVLHARATFATRLPNLRVLPASDLVLETRADGGTYLRFAMTSWNAGEGLLELRGGETDPVAERQRVYQRIYETNGRFIDVFAGSFVWHEEHNHVHFDDYANYILQAVDATGNSDRLSQKTTFCIIDNTKVNLKLKGAPKKAKYTTCAFQVQGLSVGWGDTYRNTRPGQEFDVTGLPSGDYDLIIEVDPKERITELDDSDNTSVLRVRLNFEAGTVVILS